MDGGGHLVPLSYVYGYRGGVGRRGVAQDTIGDNGLEIRARVRRYQLILWRYPFRISSASQTDFQTAENRQNGRFWPPGAHEIPLSRLYSRYNSDAG